MSDLFHEKIATDDYNRKLDQIFATMIVARNHTFQILTKRPHLAKAYFDLRNSHLGMRDLGRVAWGRIPGKDFTPEIPPDWCFEWPPKNVWLGVSVEDQKTADERIPILLKTPAAVRFVSYEPALGAVDFDRWLDPTGVSCPDICNEKRYVIDGEVETIKDREEIIPLCPNCGEVSTWTGYDPGIDWIICGGESGPNARPMHPDWARSVRDQCREAGVPLFFKQWGEWSPQTLMGEHYSKVAIFNIGENGEEPIYLKDLGEERANTWIDNGHEPDDTWMIRVGKKRAGSLLDGREHNEFPV